MNPDITPGAVKSSGASVRPEKLPSYVLVTPARNEAAHLELTIKSVAGQQILPLKWVIVSDGSTDGTDDIVKRYAEKYSWIELVRMPERAERHFAGKVIAFNAGFERLKDLKYDIIGNIDGDISFDSQYFTFLLTKFIENPSLGVAGGLCIETEKDKYDFNIVNIADVSGACQFFRHDCFTAIGGYTPIKGGGIDSLAVYMSRMKGWQTRTFPEVSFFHHRKRMGAQGTPRQGFIKAGRRDYNLGGHPLWHTLRCIYQMKNPPYLLGGLCLLYGYLSEALKGAERPVSQELVRFLRKEQMDRLRAILRRKLSLQPQASGSR
jgi:poly-beta-1,6-N-acetyl-D-glucosamine synthase